jgi:hypothetical protein
MGEARRHGTDGVIFGHIHHAVIRAEDGLTYINCGDWVESCTAVVEQFDRRLEIIEWVGERSDRGSSPVVPPGGTPANALGELVMSRVIHSSGVP